MSRSQSVTGVSSSWPTISGPPASRACWLTTAARLPPALHPATTSWPGMPPSSAAWAAIHCSAANASSAAAGKRASGRVAVVDRHDDHVRAHAQVAAERIVGLVAAEHPAAAVEVDDDRVRAGRRRAGTGGSRGRRRRRAATPSTISPTSGPGGRAALASVMNARASSAVIDSSGGRSSSAIISSTICDVGLQPVDDAVVALRAGRDRRARSRGSPARRPRRTSPR